jgi:hypothetical protein
VLPSPSSPIPFWLVRWQKRPCPSPPAITDPRTNVPTRTALIPCRKSGMGVGGLGACGGDPRVNIQENHGLAKPYLFRQVLAAISKAGGGFVNVAEHYTYRDTRRIRSQHRTTSTAGRSLTSHQPCPSKRGSLSRRVLAAGERPNLSWASGAVDSVFRLSLSGPQSASPA